MHAIRSVGQCGVNIPRLSPRGSRSKVVANDYRHSTSLDFEPNEHAADGVTAGQARQNSSNVGGVTAGQARHNSSNVGGVTAGQARHNSSDSKAENICGAKLLS